VSNSITLPTPHPTVNKEKPKRTDPLIQHVVPFRNNLKRSKHADVATMSEMTFRSPFGKPRKGGVGESHYGPVFWHRSSKN